MRKLKKKDMELLIEDNELNSYLNNLREDVVLTYMDITYIIIPENGFVIRYSLDATLNSEYKKMTIEEFKEALETDIDNAIDLNFRVRVADKNEW